MERKEFLRFCSLGLAFFYLPSFLNRSFAATKPDKIRDLFEWNDEEVILLTEKVLNECVLKKIMPPEGVLKYRWIYPGGEYFGQWIWDTMFVVQLLSVLPNQRDVIRDVFHNYRDFQYRWNNEKSEYAKDMIACMIEPNNKNWIDYPQYSQIPILAWGLEQAYNHNKDIELIHANLKCIEDFHEWYWRERDVTNIGLVAVGSYSGDYQHALFETFDFDGSLDNMKLTVHPTKHNVRKGRWYGDTLVVGNSSYLIMAERSLARLAKALGDKDMYDRRMAKVEKGCDAMRKYMWNEQDGMFYAVRRDTLEQIKETSVGCWMPLIAEVPTKDMAKRIAATLSSDAWMTPLPIATMPQNDPRYASNGFWRGDVWTVTNYQIAHGLKLYGYNDLAARIADATIENSIKNGVNERHDSQSGKPLGVENLGMSCTVVSMMLEGISKKYKLKLKNR